jgi:hypothetical protein
MWSSKKVNKFTNYAMKGKGAYEYPKLKTTGDNSFLFAMFGGVRNAGKSNAALVLLENEKDIMLSGNAKVFFISPTVDAKVKTFQEKYPEHFEIYDELTLPNMTDVLNEMKARYDEWLETKDAIDIYEKWLKDIPLDPMEEEILEIRNYFEGFDFGSFTFKHPPINVVIIDDSMSSPMLSSPQSKEGKYFIKFACKHRHYPFGTHLIFLSQHLKMIARPLRVNCNMVVLFPFRDVSIYEDIFKEYSNLFENKLDNFIGIMNECERRDNHSFALIYYDKVRFVRINYNEQVSFKHAEEEACECKE